MGPSNTVVVVVVVVVVDVEDRVVTGVVVALDVWVVLSVEVAVVVIS